MPANWRKYRNYIFVIPLCAAALFYQVTYSVVAVRTTLYEASVPASPFDSDDGTAYSVSEAAQMAGLRNGDRIRSIDGKSVTNERQLFEDVARHKPGDLLSITETPKGQSRERTLKLPVTGISTAGPGAAGIAFAVGFASVMLCCVLIAVYVALRCPYDKRALLAFSLIVSLAQVLNLADWYRFPESLWVFARVWRLGCVLNWSVAIAAFGLYFPDQFAWDRERPWAKWLYLGPLIALNLFILFWGVTPEFSFRESAALKGVAGPLDNTPSLLTAISITLFFMCMGVKWGKAINADAKRRLRLLEVGAAIGLGPVGLLLLYEVISRTPDEEIPKAVLITLCILFVVFPLTLAYIVLTDRAMDLRVVIRQGMQYTLARGGLRILLALFGLLFFSLLSWLLVRPGVSNTVRVIVYLLATAGFVFVLRRARSQMFVVIDKKFFRDSYNAELLLGELTENVRTLVDEQELLQTVSRQISDALHVSHFSVLMNGSNGLEPVYSVGLAIPENIELPEKSKTVALLTKSKEPSPIYFDRPDNWIHDTPESEHVALRALGAQLLLPLKAKERLLGMFCLGPKLSDEPFSKTDINLLRSVALQTGLALDNSRLTKAFAQEVAQRELLNREIEIAREVQERLFPQHLPAIAGIDYSGSCRPALGVGGDYYDFLMLPNGDLGVAIGDVSGKGIAAALLMASLQASLRGQALTGLTNLALLMSNVNRLIFEATPSNRYATFFYGQYSRGTRCFRYVNAGHNPPFVLRKAVDRTIQVIRLDTGGPVVGLFPETPYQQGSLTLEHGDVFVGFTDGISEAMNGAEEEWGEEHLIHCVARHVNNTAAEMIPRLMADADRFVDGAPQHDDMTLVIVKMQPEAIAAPVAA